MMAETDPSNDSSSPSSRLKPKLRVRLSLMMFLQYTIWGAWAPILVLHMQQLDDFTKDTVVNVVVTNITLQQDTKINLVYMTMAIATILSTFLAGQIADRYFSTERFLAFSQFAGGVLLIFLARLTTFPAMFWVMLLYAVIYAPTVALTNSLAFHHLPNGEKDFAGIRVWGTIGWIAIGWGIGLWLRETGADVGNCLIVAAVLSFIMAGYSITLPHTPPTKNSADPWAFLGALRLLKKRSFAVLVIVSFLVATELQFYYVLSPAYFNQGGGPYSAKTLADLLSGDNEPSDADRAAAAAALVLGGDKDGNEKLSREELETLAKNDPLAKEVADRENRTVAKKGGVRLHQGTVPIVMTFGQICEMIVLALLPFFLTRLGFRLTIAFGIAAWSVRYFVFAWCPSPEIVVAFQALHGFGFAFFFVGGFIYSDRIAGKEIKASAQALMLLVTMGAGMLVSSLVAGPISDYLERDWHQIFLVPAILTAVCTLIFLAGFRDDVGREATQEQRAA